MASDRFGASEAIASSSTKFTPWHRGGVGDEHALVAEAVLEFGEDLHARET
jgi:hypothetical protein